MIVLVLVTTLVGFVLMTIIFNCYVNRYLLENQVIETIWTLIPAGILVFVALPSLRLLYLLDEVYEPSITLKVIGRQWYWRYEYTDMSEVMLDSYIVQTSDLLLNGFRVLDVDVRGVLPYNTQVRVLVTSRDVIHSWTIPRAGVKIDAIPGRLNQIGLFFRRTGVFFGQCSEICGVNHRFIPVVIERVSTIAFLEWLNKIKFFGGWEKQKIFNLYMFKIKIVY